ncbi:DUF6207 family protein [Streptomyces sp. NPDC005385]|uniref:DUF6207 family protein n=1 Tax=Streptomyces sp. NPDC005385 TaxID=3157039 RepID=UPI0033B99060
MAARSRRSIDAVGLFEACVYFAPSKLSSAGRRAACATARAARTTREPGEPGVRLRLFDDLSQKSDA